MGPPREFEFHFTLKNAERFNLHVLGINYVYSVATAFGQTALKVARLMLA